MNSTSHDWLQIGYYWIKIKYFKNVQLISNNPACNVDVTVVHDTHTPTVDSLKFLVKKRAVHYRLNRLVDRTHRPHYHGIRLFVENNRNSFY